MSSLYEAEKLSAKGAVAPRVSLDSMKAKIATETYFTAGAAADALGIPIGNAAELLTIAILVLRSGYVLVGKSATASAENFDAKKGRAFAYEDAIRQLWPLENYLLREKLSTGFADPVAVIEPTGDLERYVGTKAINAMPMTRGDYNKLRGWWEPADQAGAEDAGYLVEYADGQRPNVEGFKGYVSWCPADVFERSYKPQHDGRKRWPAIEQPSPDDDGSGAEVTGGFHDPETLDPNKV